MRDPVEVYEEAGYDRDVEFERGPRVLWGRVIALWTALLVVFLLGFLLGRARAPEAPDRGEVERLRRDLSQAQAEIAELRARPAQTTEPTVAPPPTARPTSTPTPRATATGTPATGQRTYTVQSGDTLRGIAQRFYGDAGLARLLAEANQIDDPGKIRTGMKLVIPPRPSPSPTS